MLFPVVFPRYNELLMMHFYDAHLHFSDWQKFSNRNVPGNILFCTSASLEEEFLTNETYSLQNPGTAFLSFGIHPQLPAILKSENRTEMEIHRILYRLLDFFSCLITTRRICASGEIGFDFFSQEFKATGEFQRFLWEEQINLSVKHGMPVILHLRKAMPHVFLETSRLKLLPAVVFHGWSGSSVEASSILKKGVNAYFSIGKALLRGSRKQAETLLAVSPERILLETDAPYMTLKKEGFSNPEDIEKVYIETAQIMSVTVDELCLIIKNNFNSVFNRTFKPENFSAV